MIISFDIDNTLIPYSNEFLVEERNFFSKLVGVEPIRKGTIKLFRELRKRGCEIWIYTTSLRSVTNLKITFLSYGLKPSKIINGTINQRILKENNCSASKNANLFGIDIHIDDSKGVEAEGIRYGFKTIIIETNDKNWVNTILNKI